MNERLLNDPAPARELNPEISPELEEILFRALERDPRNRYSTVADLAWELEHQELVGVDGGHHRPALHGRFAFNRRKALVYAALALVPVMLFLVMLLLARR
jgi:serine/threonine-protein kinase